MTQTQERARIGPPAAPPPLGAWELGRWAWRQLTSMRTALLLLFLLALASVPGSVIPQKPVNPVKVADFIQANPGLSRWYDRFGLFDVFGSAWFAAIYLLLLVSLLGCVLPRMLVHWRVLQSRPPAAPRHLDRLPAHRRATTDAAPGEVLTAASDLLRARRYRVVVDDPGNARGAGPGGGADADASGRVGSVAGEKGYLREVGNLVFHLAIVVVLLGVAVGGLFGFRGTALVVEGSGFADTVTQYDGYQGGALFDENQLPPFALTVKKFHVRWETSGEQRGSARDFVGSLSYTASPQDKPHDYQLRVNHPLQVDGTEVHLIGHGYAPRFTVRDGSGAVAFSGPVPFLPQDGRFTSTGVVKVPDARPDQLAFQGFFLPTAVIDRTRGPVSAFPDTLNPTVYLTAYHGDLGLDNGVPQSVYRIESKAMKQFRSPNGQPFRLALTPGHSAKLPGGAGTITFDGYVPWVNLQVSRNPGAPIALVGAVLALGGLLLSLRVRQRRVWVRVARDGGRTVVAVAGLDKGERLGDRSARGRGPETTAAATSGGTPADVGDAADPGEQGDLDTEVAGVASGLPGAVPVREE